MPCDLEKELWARGYRALAGIDEAGRGPLAGPVVAGAVILPPGVHIPALADSKRLSPGVRLEVYQKIREVALGVGIGIVDPSVIDEINILRASLRAMDEALKNLGYPADCVLVDGPYRLPGLGLPQHTIIHGDRISICVAAASVVAKVTRDRIMMDLDAAFPGYGFAKNKGYGTREHLEALKRLGPSPVHRRSFKPVRELANAFPPSILP